MLEPNDTYNPILTKHPLGKSFQVLGLWVQAEAAVSVCGLGHGVQG